MKKGYNTPPEFDVPRPKPTPLPPKTRCKNRVLSVVCNCGSEDIKWMFNSFYCCKCKAHLENDFLKEVYNIGFRAGKEEFRQALYKMINGL